MRFLREQREMKKFLAVVVFCLPAFGQAAYSGSTLYQGAAVYGTAGAPFGFAELPQNWVNPTICNPPGGLFFYTVVLDGATTTNLGPSHTGDVGGKYTLSQASLQDALINWRDNSDNAGGGAHFHDDWWLVEIPVQGSSGSTYISAATYPSNSAAITLPGKLNPTGNVEPTKCLVIDSQDAVANPSHLPAGRMVCGHGLANFGGARNPGCSSPNDKQYMWKMVLSNLPGYFAGIYAQEDAANPLASSIAGHACRTWSVCVPYANHILIKHGELTIAPGAAQSLALPAPKAPFFFQAADGGVNGAPGSGVYIPGIWSTNLGVVGMYMHGWDPGDPGQPTTSAATVTAISCSGGGPYTCTYTAANTFQPGQIVNITGTYTCPACIVLSAGLSTAHFEVSQATSPSCVSSCGTTATQDTSNGPLGACGSWTNTGTVNATADGSNTLISWASGTYYGMTFKVGSTVYINSTAQTIYDDGTLAEGLQNGTNNNSFVVTGLSLGTGSGLSLAQSNPPSQYQVGCGDDVKNAMQFNVDGGWLQDSYIEKIHQWGSESHGVGAGFMYGPLKIVNNWIEGGSAAWFSGGAAVDTNGGPAADLEIRRNHFGADLNWRQLTGGGGGSPSPPFGCGPSDGSASHNACPFSWGRKPAAEFKVGSRVLLAGNEIEDAWTDGQNGFCASWDPRVISAGQTAGVYNASTGVPLTSVDNIRIESNWFANCLQLTFSPRSSTAGNGGGVSKPMFNIDVVNNLFSNIGDSNQFGSDSSPLAWLWTSGEIKYPCAMSASGGNATAACAPAQSDLSTNTTSIVAVQQSGGGPCGTGCSLVTISTNIARMDPILCQTGTYTLAQCVSWGWTVPITYSGWSGTFGMTATTGNWNADGTGGGNSVVYADTVNNPSGTLCSSLSDCKSKLASPNGLSFASLGYKITDISVGDGVYLTNLSAPDTTCTTQGYANAVHTSPVKALPGTNPYGTGASMTVVFPSSGTGAANCLISNAPGPPNGVTYQNNTTLAMNRYSILNYGKSFWPINNWFWNNVFADNGYGLGSASDMACNNPTSGNGEGTSAFTCWDSQTLEFYKNSLVGKSSGSWSVVDPLGQCLSGCANSFPALPGGYPSASCVYSGSNPLNCPMMGLPWMNPPNFTLTGTCTGTNGVACMSGNPPSTQGVNITQLTNTATANIYTCPASLSCGSYGPYPDH